MEQPKYTAIRGLFKATYRKALIIFISVLLLLGILVFMTNATAYFSVQINPYVIGIMSGFVYLLSILLPVMILAYILYVLIKAK